VVSIYEEIKEKRCCSCQEQTVKERFVLVIIIESFRNIQELC